MCWSCHWRSVLSCTQSVVAWTERSPHANLAGDLSEKKPPAGWTLKEEEEDDAACKKARGRDTLLLLLLLCHSLETASLSCFFFQMESTQKRERCKEMLQGAIRFYQMLWRRVHANSRQTVEVVVGVIVVTTWRRVGLFDLAVIVNRSRSLLLWVKVGVFLFRILDTDSPRCWLTQWASVVITAT